MSHPLAQNDHVHLGACYPRITTARRFQTIRRSWITNSESMACGASDLRTATKGCGACIHAAFLSVRCHCSPTRMTCCTSPAGLCTAFLLGTSRWTWYVIMRGIRTCRRTQRRCRLRIAVLTSFSATHPTRPLTRRSTEPQSFRNKNSWRRRGACCVSGGI